MDRDHLARMLERNGEAFAACRRAVLAGAQFLVADTGQPASELVRTYVRRERHAQQRAIPTQGFAEAVAALRAQGEHQVRIGAVEMVDPRYHFELFVNEDGTAVIACLGVGQSRHTASGTTTASVREWRDDEGWGVLDSSDTPGGCWAHFSHLDMPGYHTLSMGQVVRLDWESPGQDCYDYRAVRVVP